MPDRSPQSLEPSQGRQTAAVGAGATASASFARKVRLSTLAIVLERMWPRLWLLVGLAALFVALSLAGLWGHLDETSHKIVLGAFALAALAVAISLLRVRAPARAEALERMERTSGVPHRPATAYEDSLSLNAADPATNALWQEHRNRLARVIGRLRPARPEPRTDKRDPIALRALALLAVLVLTIAAGDSASDRLAAAFRFGPLAKSTDARLDAWVTPPAYTGKAPMMLADGARPGGTQDVAGSAAIEMPQNSVLIARGSGKGMTDLVVEITEEGGTVRRVTTAQPGEGSDTREPAKASGAAIAAAVSEIAEVKTELKKSSSVRLIASGTTVASWTFKIIPDHPPTVALTKTPERSLRGSLRIPYKVEDDYGVAALDARISRIPPKPDNSSSAWAREEMRAARKGPRAPSERPPAIALRLNQSYPKSAQGVSLHEMADHMWAGMPVRLQLVAKDLAGQTGRSEPYDMLLPMREFRKPLARAVVEQRRRLVEDSRLLRDVALALDALTMEPDGFITDYGVYLGLRSVQHRLKAAKLTRKTRNDAIRQLWHIALKIEDGALSDAERRLREIQDKLSQALRDGATDEEIQRLMQELRQALNEFLQEMQRQAQDQPPMDPRSMDPNRMMSSRDLDQMLRNLENMMRNGNRDQAQQMLSELRDLLDRLQSGRMAQGQQGQQGQMGQMMNELGELLGRQQQLLDDTFGQQQGQQGDQQGQQGQQGQRRQQGQQGQRGQRGQRGQQGQQGQQGQPGGEGGEGQQGLGDRQQALRDMLNQLQRGMRGMGMETPGQFDGAGEAMGQAEQALRSGDLDQALEAEGRALEQLRQGARNMAEQMMRQQGQQAGPGPNGNPGELDPLGRPPQHTDGADPGLLTKVPDQIDTQRAREILEELRRRLGEQTRPPVELEYLERLLKRF